MTTNYWLSIDFDYFVREDPAWDWGHRESPFFRDIMWVSRAMGAIAGGFDIRSLMDPNKWAAPKPLELTSLLATKGIIIDDECEVLVSDSHCFGFGTFGHEEETADILLSFDAHHDLGYNVEKVLGNKSRGEVHCDDWLIMLLDRHPYLETQIIYPEWKKDWLNEWQSVENRQSGEENCPNWMLDALERVEQKIWSPDINFPEGVITKTHICRSGSWVPPWLDELFGDLCANVAMATINDPETPYIDVEQCNPLEPRNFDWGQMEIFGQQQKEAMDKIREHNRKLIEPDQNKDDMIENA